MATKGELSDELNQMLDTSIDWSELKKDDLELLIELVDEGHLLEPMAKQLVSSKGQEYLDEKVEEWEAGDLLRRVI